MDQNAYLPCHIRNIRTYSTLFWKFDKKIEKSLTKSNQSECRQTCKHDFIKKCNKTDNMNITLDLCSESIIVYLNLIYFHILHSLCILPN